MNLIKVNTIPSIFNRMDSIMDGFFDNSLYNDWRHSYEVFHNDKEYTIVMDLPGLNKSKINLEIQDQRLSVSGNREVRSDLSESYNSSRYGEFDKEFNIPEDVLEKNISAQFKNGVLEITLPRKKEVQAKVQKIAVK